MTEQELAEIRSRIRDAREELKREGQVVSRYFGLPTVERLLAEVERLRAQIAAMQNTGGYLADRYDAFMESEYGNYRNEESDDFRKAAGLIESAASEDDG